MGLPDISQGPVIVKVRYFVLNIRGIDSAQQTFEGDIFIRLRWQDGRLRSTGDTHSIRRLPLSSIWNPEANIWNSSSIKTAYDTVVEVAGDGTVTYRQRINGRFDAKFDLRDFPFDKQEVGLRLISGRYNKDQVTFVADEEGSGMAEHIEIPEWKVSETTVDFSPMPLQALGAELPSFNIKIPVQRDSAFYVRKMLVPLFLILAMAYAVLWIEPGQFGSQIGVCTGAIFSFIAFRFSLSVLLPRISYFTRMDEFVFGATLLVFLPLGKAIVTSRLVKAERIALVKRLDQWSRWLYPLGIGALVWFTFIK